MVKLNGVPFEYKGDNTFAYHFFKALVKDAGLNLTTAVGKFNKVYPDLKTTPQNVSNKLTRDSIRFTEFVKFADVLGYEINLVSAKNHAHEDDSTVVPVVSEKRTSADNSIRDAYRPIKATQDKQQKDILKSEFSKALVSGCVSIPSVHFGDIMVAGKQAQEGADWLKTIINPEITEAQEMAAILAVREYYDAIAQATYQLSMFRLRKKD